MNGITLRSVGKRYGDVRVIEHLDLQIRECEFMVFVGPSGCGKTTALRMIAGLEEVSEGQVLIGDRVVNDVPPKDRDVAMVFQNYALYPHMTVRENLAFALKIRRLPADEIRRMVDDAAGMLGLAPLLDRKPNALSGGQRQRVALGRALVRKPAVFLFDEPLSNLDADLRVQMRAELAKLQRRLRTTTVYVTHDQVEAMTLGHRIAVFAPLQKDMKNTLQQLGTPQQVYDRPNNVFVARFIGTPSMNLLTMTVGSDCRLLGSGISAAPPTEWLPLLKDYVGRSVVMGIRPEQVAEPGVHAWPNTAAANGPVKIIETIGHEVIVHVAIGADLLIARLDARRAPRYGEFIELVVNCDALHLFDPASGLRLE
ncbi:MAG: ABC transporter ATP-binding protein [Steroidobacteraceae bacterium]